MLPPANDFGSIIPDLPLDSLYTMDKIPDSPVFDWERHSPKATWIIVFFILFVLLVAFTVTIYCYYPTLKSYVGYLLYTEY